MDRKRHSPAKDATNGSLRKRPLLVLQSVAIRSPHNAEEILKTSLLEIKMTGVFEK